MKVFSYILVFACIGVCVWQVVGFIQDFRKKKQLKKQAAEEEKKDGEK